mgnify:CR=1 FL=1
MTSNGDRGAVIAQHAVFDRLPLLDIEGVEAVLAAAMIDLVRRSDRRSLIPALFAMAEAGIGKRRFRWRRVMRRSAAGADIPARPLPAADGLARQL